MFSKTLSASAAAIAVAGVAAASHAATVTAVGVYDENVIQANTVDDEAGNISLADFSADVANAFLINAGGVVSFDDLADGQVAISGSENLVIGYGVSGTNTLTASLYGPTGASAAADQTEPAGQVSISGGNFIGISGNGGGIGFAFDMPLSAFGITVLDRVAAGRTASLSVLLDGDTDATVVTADPIAIGDAEFGDTFFGYEAPEGRTIQAARITTNGYLRYDDLGFIVAGDDTVVPEPSSILAAMAGVGLFAARRRR